MRTPSSKLLKFKYIMFVCHKDVIPFFFGVKVVPILE